MGPGDQPDATPPQGALPQRRYSRRRILAAGVAGSVAVAAGGAGLGYWATRGGSNSPAAAPSPTRTPSATPTPAQGLDLITPANPDIAEVRSFAPNEEIDWTAGLFYLDAASGGVEGWRLSEHGAATPAVGQNAFTYPVRGGDIVTVTAGQPAPTYAVSRDRSRAWQWPSDRLALVDRVGEHFIFTSMPAGDITAFVTNRNFKPVSKFSLNTQSMLSPLVAAPDARHVVVGEAIAGGGSRIRYIDLETGKDVSTHTFDPGLGQLGRLQLIPLTGELLVGVTRQTTDAKGNINAQHTSRMHLPWGFDWAGLKEYDAPLFGDVSPDGRYELRTTFIDGANGLGALYWPAVELYDLDLTQRFALLSAAPPLWLGAGSQWLADSSAFVIMNSAGKVDGPAWANYAYSLVEPSGVQRAIGMPPLPPESSPDYSPWAYSPTPHPTNSSLLALGTTGALDLKSGKFVRANLGKVFPPPVGDPWFGRPTEVMFTLPVPGKDGPGVPFFINMKLIHGEIPTPPLHFTVQRTGDCLNMRDAASLKGNIIGCIPDGTALTMADAKPTPQVPFGSWAAGDDGAWVYVSTAGGLTGWVAAPYLDWAV